MKKNALVILALLSLLLTGCATKSIPPEKQKDFSLIKLGEFRKNAAINDIDGTSVYDLTNTGRDVLPGKHKVMISVCASGCLQYYYSFETKAGLAYILGPNEIDIFDRFNFKNKVDTLEQSKFSNVPDFYYTSDERMQFAKKAEDAEAAAQALITERRVKNLPMVKKIGARICLEKAEPTRRRGFNRPLVYVYVGYVESLTEDKVQIRISDANLKGVKPSNISRLEGFTPSVIWDSPMNWDLCEQ